MIRVWRGANSRVTLKSPFASASSTMPAHLAMVDRAQRLQTSLRLRSRNPLLTARACCTSQLRNSVVISGRSTDSMRFRSVCGGVQRRLNSAERTAPG